MKAGIAASAMFDKLLVTTLARNLATNVYENSDAVLAMFALACAISATTPSVRQEHQARLHREATTAEGASSLLLTALVAAAIETGCSLDQVLGAVREGFDMLTAKYAKAEHGEPAPTGGVN